MADIIPSYTALSASSARSDVSTVLQSIIDLSPAAIDDSSRQELMKYLLRDLKAISSYGGTKTLSSKDATKALLALKNLGKHPAGSGYLASHTNLSALLSLSSSFKDDPEASGEALRCVANALLLIERARSTFLDKEVDGGNICVTMLEKSTLPDQIFILSRILFLCTASGPHFIYNLVEDKYHGRTTVEIIGSKLDILTVGLLSGTKMAREALSDILKLTFNILLHYPKMVESDPQTPEAKNSSEDKVMGDFWNSKLDSILAPLLRTFTSLPPTFPNPIAAPLSHVIHALLTVPITPELRSAWLGGANTSSPQPGTTGSKHTSRSQTPQPATAAAIAAASSSSSRSDSPTPAQPSPTSPKLSTLDRALSVISAGRRSLSPRSPSTASSPSLASAAPAVNALQRACDLLDVAFSHYYPDSIDVDDQSVRDRCKQESPDTSLDDLLSPLVVLISKFCTSDESSRTRVRKWIAPDDLDRSAPLEERADMLGRCLRIMQSVYHQRLKESVGELLYAMCDSDASVLSALMGYGNVAGFLFHKGIVNAPPPPSATTSTFNPPTTTPSGAAINPITGTTFESRQDLPEMTDEEKEREVDKLFVLFDRLEKTGAIPASQNPMRKAIQEGKVPFP